MSADHESSHGGTGWRLLDYAVIGAAGVLLGMLLVAYVNHRQSAPGPFPDPEPPAPDESGTATPVAEPARRATRRKAIPEG